PATRTSRSTTSPRPSASSAGSRVRRSCSPSSDRRRRSGEPPYGGLAALDPADDRGVPLLPALLRARDRDDRDEGLRARSSIVGPTSKSAAGAATRLTSNSRSGKRK